MPVVTYAGLLAVGVLAAQLVETQACRQTRVPVDAPVQAPAPSPLPAPPGPSEAFTTSDGVRYQVQTVVTGLEVPWSLAFAPDGRLFVTERPGRVRIITLASGSSQLALTLDDVAAQGEGGLLGVALDPTFAQSRHVYLYYTARDGSGAVNRVVRYRDVDGRLGERTMLIDRIPASTIHDGGRLRFGPDGLLYITTGDAATTSLAQDAASLAGKILRIRSDGGSAPGNRFGSPVYTLGHRNPQGLDWHPTTGELWASEHGATGNDEINIIRGGANYGWPTIQGGATGAGLESPVAFFNPAIAPSGASFSTGDGIPAFRHNLFVGALRGAHLLRVRVDGGASGRILGQERLLDQRYGRIRDVVTGPDGFLYFCTNNRDGRGTPSATDDIIARLVPAS
jgi:glucose/arabinose dehydrogenase